jgi:hypothetical protein
MGQRRFKEERYNKMKKKKLPSLYKRVKIKKESERDRAIKEGRF